MDFPATLSYACVSPRRVRAGLRPLLARPSLGSRAGVDLRELCKPVGTTAACSPNVVFWAEAVYRCFCSSSATCWWERPRGLRKEYSTQLGRSLSVPAGWWFTSHEKGSSCACSNASKSSKSCRTPEARPARLVCSCQVGVGGRIGAQRSTRRESIAKGQEARRRGCGRAGLRVRGLRATWRGC